MVTVPSVSTHHVEWIRPPRQNRSQETLERILDAAEEVLGLKGFEEATVAEIAARAQSSVGAFYTRFRDKDALLNCLQERFREQALATADVCLDPERWRGATIDEILAELIPFLVQIYGERRGLIRAFLLRGGRDREFAAASVQLGNYVARRLSELLLARASEIAHPQPALAIDFGLRLVLGILDQTTLFAELEHSVASLAPVHLSEQLVLAFSGYLGIGRGGAPQGEL